MYTGASLVATTGVTNAFRIQRWLEAGAAAGATYVGLPVTAINPQAGEWIVHFSNLWKVNCDMVAALIAHESAFLQSHISRDKNNPGGYGAENDDPYNKAIHFPTLKEGIRAVVAHLAGYVYGDGEWNQHSPRYKIVKANGWHGSVKALTDLNGKWAHPGTTYGQSLARIASDLVRFAETVNEAPPPFNPIIAGNNIRGVPFRVSILPEGKPNRVKLPMTSYAGPLIHETGNFNTGAGAEMHRRFVHNGGGNENVAFHFVLDDKEIIQLLPLNEGGYHAGNAACNRSRWGIEVCVNPDSDFSKALQNAAKLVQFLWEYAPVTKNRIGQHFDCSGKNCPMRLRAGQWSTFMAFVEAKEGVDPNERIFPETGKKIIMGFKGHFEKLEAMDIAFVTLGFPQTDEFKTLVDRKERTVQIFERGGLGWYPESAGTVWEFRHLTRGELWSAIEDARKQGVLK